MTTAPETSTNSVKDFLNVLQNASEEERNFLLAGLTQGEMTFPNKRWDVFAHRHQLPPS
jgi:hypothetical protein